MSSKANFIITQAGQAFSATTFSGLTPSIVGDNCTVRDAKITALINSGTCTLTITTTGGRNFKPEVTSQTYTLG